MKTFFFNTSILWNVLKLSVWLIYGKLVIISHNLKIKDLCLFLSAIITKCHKLHGLKQHKFILSQFWKLKVHNQGDGKAVIPLKSIVMTPSLPLLVSYGFTAVFGVSWLVATTLQSLPLSSHTVLLSCVSVSSPPLIRMPVILDKFYLDSVWPHLNLITPPRPFFQIGIYS